MKRMGEPVTKLFFSVSAIDGCDDTFLSEAIDRFGKLLQKNVRKSDIMMQHRMNHFLVLLPELSEDNVHVVIERVMGAWNSDEYCEKVRIEYIKECFDFSDE